MVPANGGAGGSARRAPSPTMRRMVSASSRAPSPMKSVGRTRSASSKTSGRPTIGASTSRPSSYRAANTSPRHASTHVATRTAPAIRARASNPEIPTSGFPSANASHCIVAIPIRSPVNDPGPLATAKRSMSASLTPARSSNDIRSAGRCSACAFGVSLTCSYTTRPSRASAQLPDEVVVSRAKTSTG